MRFTRLYVTLLFVGVLLPLAIASRHAAAQPLEQFVPGYTHKVWTTRDGLPQNMVRALLQTRDGYLWIGTGNGGLVRFDGVAFTVFDILNTPELPANWITTLHEDASGVLWIGTATGLVSYRHGVFTRENAGVDPPYAYVRSLQTDRDGHLWMVTSALVARRDGERWTKIALGGRDVTSLLFDREGTAWLGTSDGLVEWRGHVSRTLGVADGLPSATIGTLYEDRAGQLWVGTTRGLARLNRTTGRAEAERAPLAGVAISQIFEDREGVLWAGSVSSLFTRMPGGQAFRHSLGPVAEGGMVLAFAEDRDGHVWFGVDGGPGGLHRLRRKRVSVLAHEQGLPCDNVAPVTEGADGTVWVGTACGDGGVVAIRQGRIEHYREPAFVASLLAEPDGRIWAGTYGGGLYRFAEGRFVRDATAGALEGSITALHRDGEGALWMGTNRGLTRLQDGQLTTFGAKEGFGSGTVGIIAEDNARSLWIGGSAGLSHYEHGRFTNYSTADGLAPGAVRAIHADSEGTLWIGSYGGGLTRFKANRFTAYGTQGGLLETAVHRILADDEGYFWLTGDRGIRRVSRRELNAVADGNQTRLSATLFDEADGMKSAECNGMGQPAGWRMRDGTLWLPSQGGLVLIDPKRARDDVPATPMPKIERATIDETTYPLGETITVPPGSRNVEIQYTAPAFARAEHVQFRYRLEGYDADWVEAGARRAAHYANLAPGSYRFVVSARSIDGRWNEETAAVALDLQSYLHQRLAFRLAAILLAAVALFVAARWRVAHLRRRTRELDAIVTERTAEVVRQRDEMAGVSAGLETAKTLVEQSHAQLLSVLNQLEIGAIVLDTGGIIRYVSDSAQRLLRKDAAALIGRSWSESLPLGATEQARVAARINAVSPAGPRLPVQIVVDTLRYLFEIDIREVPPPGAGRILYLYNVTEMSAVGARGARRGDPYELIGQATPMQVLYRHIRDVAKSDTTVLIEGETGSGKELVARAIHRGSNRADKPFIAVNSAGLTESVIASQLFGHRRGAFTGAVADQIGVFEAAQGGTLFLDEIGDLPPGVQASLLRVLQEHEITRLGDTRARKLDVRFLAATHRDLGREVSDGRFRQDLFYRIRVATIQLPPLRERIEDIPLLVEVFLTQAAKQAGKAVPEMSREAMDALARFSWPGNVRELKSAIEHAVLSSSGRVLTVGDLPAEIVRAESSGAITGATERERLLEALRRSGGNRSEAARLLGIGRATLYRKLALHGIDTDG